MYKSATALLPSRPARLRLRKPCHTGVVTRSCQRTRSYENSEIFR